VVNLLTKRLLRGMEMVKFGRDYFYPQPTDMPEHGLTMYSGFSCAGEFVARYCDCEWLRSQPYADGSETVRGFVPPHHSHQDRSRRDEQH
jgi:hypothetical protein